MKVPEPYFCTDPDQLSLPLPSVCADGLDDLRSAENPQNGGSLKIAIDQAALNTSLAAVTRATRPGAESHYMRGVLLTPRSDGILLAATDGDIEIKSSLECTVENPSEPICIPAVNLQSYISRLRPGEVNLEVVLGNILLSQGRSRQTLPPIVTDDFPSLSETDADLIAEVTIPGSHLIEASESTLFTLGLKGTGILHGVHLALKKNEVVFTSCDKCRFSEYNVPDVTPSAESEAVLPGEFLKAAVAISEGFEATLTLLGREGVPNRITCRAGSAEITSRLEAGSYPSAIIGKVWDLPRGTVILVERAELLSAIKRVSLVIDEDQPRSVWNVSKGELVMTCEGADGQSEELVEIKSFGGDPLRIGISVKYAAQAIAKIDTDDVLISFGKANEAVLFRPDTPGHRFRHAALPIKV